ncbi:MAG: hypothetical protein EOP45_03640 [Sphingobacteriaceae bacterium]|nr:MAG: hypothetical protein EOP45_03640 [Sphingobacteriaceae bacterium]
MKSLNLRSIVSLLLLSVAFTACKKSPNIEKPAKSENTENIAGRTAVIHYDVLFTCNSCPGSIYDIVFTNENFTYHIGNDLTPFGITARDSLPINVTVTSKHDNATGMLVITTLKINK